MLRKSACILVAASVLALGGCVSAGTVADKIVGAPNGGHPAAYPGAMGKIARAFYSARYSIPVGPPPATLAFAIVEPRNYGFSAAEKPGKTKSTRVFEWQVANAPAAAFADYHIDSMDEFAERISRGLARAPLCQPPAGTVILLPGWGEQKETLLGYALDFANHGYRVILVDLRGQGASSGDYVSFGLV
ncbi:MAG TPA: hypothetical protein VFX38_05635, partial [Gammaproteobacteria bacterium]|nr:hypothetical protein [Gammaproteobacteria bacterium]